MTRRQWAGYAFGAALASTTLDDGVAAETMRTQPVRLGVLTDASVPTHEAERAGLEFGMAEAAHLATLLGSRLVAARGDVEDDLDSAPPVLVVPAPAAVAVARRHPQSVVVTTRRQAIPADLACYSVASSERALARAERHTTPNARLADWHPGLRRYGAAQLNERFRRAAQRDMDEHAWHGWFACKVAVELVIRRADEPGVPLADVPFDGHKGRALTFSADDHHLVQPVYLVADGEEGLPREILPEDGGR